MDPKLKRNLIILKLFEDAPLSTSQIEAKLALTEETPTSLRTIQREPLFQTKRGFLKKNGHEYFIEINQEYYLEIGNIIHTIFEQSALRNWTHGTINPRAIAQNLQHFKKPAHVLLQIIEAVENNQILSFFYRPQTEGTANSLKHVKHLFPINTPRGTMPVKILPRFFIFSTDHFCISGETYYIGYNKPFYKQYELRGITDIKTENVMTPVLNIDLIEEYKYALKVWHGGKTHKLTLEEKSPGNAAEIKTYEQSVQGEEEILSMVAGSLGRIRIVNPPDEIVDYARRYNLPGDIIFIFRN